MGWLYILTHCVRRLENDNGHKNDCYDAHNNKKITNRQQHWTGK